MLLDDIDNILYNCLENKIVERSIMANRGKQANFLLPEGLLDELRESVPRRQQSRFVVDTLRKELNRLKLEKVLQTTFGAWKTEDHPELKKGADRFVRTLRKSRRVDRAR
jgi:hypothetical protein